MVGNNTIIKKCENCNKEFELRSFRLNDKSANRGKFCSRECYHIFIKGKPMNVTKYKFNCTFCGKLNLHAKCGFDINAKHHFCNQECHYNYRRKISKNKKLICKECGKEFIVRLSRYKNTNVGYCSRKCSGKAYSDSKRTTFKCRQCGKLCSRIITHKIKNKINFCSNKCKYEFRVGENSSTWQGGIAFLPYPYEFNNKLREQIRKRDNHTCQECGFTQDQLGYTLPVHHIDYNKKNNNPKNLISLCKNCHAQTNFTRSEWTDYLKSKVKVNA